MTEHERLIRDVEEHEAWLRGACVDPAFSRMDEVKALVRDAVDEERTAQERSARANSDTAEGSQDAVLRGAYRPARRGRAFRKPALRVGSIVALGLAAAACVVAAVGLYDRQAVGDELPLLSAFGEYADDDVDRSLTAIDDDLSALESALAAHQGLDADNSFFEGLLDSDGDADENEPS